MIRTLLYVALGGALGALCRFGLGKAMEHWNPHTAFSAGTLTANLIGCLMMGFLFVVVGQADEALREALIAFLLVGFLGSLTTFSTFVLEFFKLSQAGESRLAVGHLACHLLIGAAGLWLGYSAAQRLTT